MPRRATGTVYESRGTWFARVPDAPKDYLLSTCSSREQASARKDLMASVGARLKPTLHADLIGGIYEQLADADDDRVQKILLIVDGLLAGKEKRAIEMRGDERTSFRQFGERWTSGRLYRDFPAHVKPIDQHDNKARLESHVYPVIGDVPMREFTVDHADLVLAQPTIPKGSLRHVALVLHRVVSLAVYPGKLLVSNPLPRGWLPKPPASKAKGWLYPSEDAKLLACKSVPLVRRLLEGVLDREGPRASEAARLEWSNLYLDHPDGGGSINLDENKTDDPRSWALDRGVAEALRRWKTIAPPSPFVFPAEAMPRSRLRGRPMYVDDLAEKLRDDLRAAGIDRSALFGSSAKRMRLRAHDERATFITLSLANGRTETWVQDRTGHKSSTMINTYRRQARQAAELNLGPLAPLYLAIPELAAMGPAPWERPEAAPAVSRVNPASDVAWSDDFAEAEDEAPTIH